MSLMLVICYMTSVQGNFCHIIDDKRSLGDQAVGMSMANAVASLPGLVGTLLEAGAEQMRAAGRRKKPDRRPARCTTLRPGPDTPVWNQLVKHAAPYLRKRGDKVRLARLLGVSRQRLHQLLVERSACADAERTLLLVAWVHARRSGQEWV